MELWKEVDGNRTYSVSSHGRIKNVKTNTLKQPSKDCKGYCIVVLYDSVAGKNFNKKIHRLVASAFIPNPNRHPQVNHKNGIKSDNRVENLEWCTPRSNVCHAVSKGLLVAKRGSKHGMAKITECDVKIIRDLYATGMYTQKHIADIYKISRVSVSDIVNKRLWRHV